MEIGTFPFSGQRKATLFHVISDEMTRVCKIWIATNRSRITSPSSQKRSNNVTPRCLSERKAGDALPVAKQREVIATDANQVFMLLD